MAATKEELIDALSNLKVMEVVDLIKALEDKWGVSAAAPVAVAAGRRPPPALLRRPSKSRPSST